MKPTQPPSSQRRLTILLALTAGVAVLAISVVIVLVVQDNNDSVATPTPNVATSAAHSIQPNPPAVSAVPPTMAPVGITWSLVGQVTVPASGSDGPSRTSGCAASGFARSPVGALIAAAQISTRAGYYAGRSCWEPTITGQLAASPDRDALLAALKEADAQGQPGAAPGDLAQIVAFRYLSYTNETAVVGLIRRNPQGRLSQTTLTLTWADGDWRLVAPPGGKWPALTASLTSLTGAVMWGAS